MALEWQENGVRGLLRPLSSQGGKWGRTHAFEARKRLLTAILFPSGMPWIGASPFLRHLSVAFKKAPPGALNYKRVA